LAASCRRFPATSPRGKLSVGYFAQHQVDELNLDGSPYDHVRKLMRIRPRARSAPASAPSAFPARRRYLVKSLSGGEKARLLLGLATFFGPNMIILDEPTNHLDIDKPRGAAEAINDFPGAVIMVSHDRYLIEACADQLWVVADRAGHEFRRRPRRLPAHGAVVAGPAHPCAGIAAIPNATTAATGRSAQKTKQERKADAA